jgi:putative oxidoreductase
MNKKFKHYSLLVIRILIGLAFFGAGAAKLAGVEMMVASFEAIGLGQWFRYLTGVIEVGSAILLFVPGKQAWGAGLLVCTMIGAVLAHLLILGPGSAPAIILGLLSALVAYNYRDQIPLPNTPA